MRFDELKDNFGVPTPSAEEIAKKHNVPVAMINRELKKGQEVEKEHVAVRKLANEIARDHLNEIPDYYKRLDKMEREAGVGVSEGQDQRSTYDQVVTLHQLATDNGLYDAADWVKMHLDRWFDK